ncbi:MAG: xanthine dehydrogenase family protein molybdopterin-binding subunit, partial [Candidatus Rokubacteria bacterium]|nr:xanthine dehydrogenase family protein molybdopterin-binding subunit [Candidatus Rokubacteria bacterium]
MRANPGARWIGAPRRRTEDRPLLTGRGRFTDDISRPGTVHVWFVRSLHAHARITVLDVTAAAASPVVVGVVTAEHVRHLGQPSVNPFFPEMKIAPHPLLADGVVRAVGEPVAAVAAETAAAARDAAERVRVEYERRPAVVDAEAALGDEALVMYPELGTNRAFSAVWRVGDMATARATAARAIRLRVEQARLAAVPLEPRAILAEWDGAAGELTVWTSTQVPFRVRSELALVLGLGEERIRVIAPAVGGGFGAKGAAYRDEALVAWLALTLGRPVKWVSTRGEDFLTTQQGRGARADGTLYVTADGRIAGLEARIVLPLGAQAMINGPAPARNHARTLPGAYVVPAVDIEVTGAYTTTPPTGPYRGAGRPEGIFLIERLVDEAARALGLDPAEMRRRSFVPAGAFPYRTATGQVYDSGDYAAALERALALADYPALRAEQARRRARGEITGIGLAAYVEPAALGWESASVRVERTGAVTVVTGSSAHGQGHETVWAQIVADALGVEPERVRVLHGDTRGAPQAIGTFGSRSTALGGSAAWQAAVEVRERGRRLAAERLEAAVEDVVVADGGFHVVGAPARRVSWAAVAALAYRGRGVLYTSGAAAALTRVDLGGG